MQGSQRLLLWRARCGVLPDVMEFLRRFPLLRQVRCSLRDTVVEHLLERFGRGLDILLRVRSQCFLGSSLPRRSRDASMFSCIYLERVRLEEGCGSLRGVSCPGTMCLGFAYPFAFLLDISPASSSQLQQYR